MIRPLDITDLGLECTADGRAFVKVWCKCASVEDIDDIINWLGLARALMVQWRIIRMGKHATAAQQQDHAPRSTAPDAGSEDQR